MAQEHGKGRVFEFADAPAVLGVGEAVEFETDGREGGFGFAVVGKDFGATLIVPAFAAKCKANFAKVGNAVLGAVFEGEPPT